ncbi:MAG: DUF748 domain-containing protein [Nitrospira sp.]
MPRILRPRILLILSLSALLLYSLVGFLGLPYIAKHYVVPALAEKIQHPVVVREIALNPFTLALTIDGLEIREADQTPILGFEQFVVNLGAKTLLLQTYAFDEIHLVMPFVSMKVDRAGKMNLLGLVPPSDPTEAPSAEAQAPAARGAVMPLEIGLLKIEQGIVEFRDESKPKPFEMTIVPIHISLRNFSTVQGGENAYAFTAEVGKRETLAWEGRVALEPIESDGKLTLAGVQLKPLYQYVQDRVGFEVRDGQLSVEGRYHVDLKGAVPNVTVRDAKVSVVNLAIGEKGPEDPVISVPSFAVEGIAFDLIKKRVDVARVHSADARFEAWINPDGVLNFQELFVSPGAPAPVQAQDRLGSGASSPPKEKPWTVEIVEVALSNYRAMFEDRTLAQQSHLEVEGMNLTVKGVKLPLKDPLQIDLALKLNQTGRVGVKGTVQIDPLVADLDMSLKEIGFRPFQPYADPFVDVDIRDGALDLSGKVRFVKDHGSKPLLTFEGNLAAHRLAITDRKEFDDILSWKSLGLTRVVLAVDPTSVRVGEVAFVEPAVTVMVQADGTMNLSQIAKAKPGESASPAETQPAPSAPVKSQAGLSAAIDVVKVTKASMTFRDGSIQPSVKIGITDLTGTIKGLSSKEMAKADVEFTGKVNRVAPMQIAGKINPLSGDAYSDVTVKFDNIDLLAVAPYAGKYAGYPISKGKLSLDLAYKVAQQELVAENKVAIDQLTFGEKTNSPDATSLPVPLVVALLKDRKGRIDIDLPIRGDLKDPDFKYGKVVISTVLNLLGKVVASPFSLMGKLIPGGGDGEDLQFIEFVPGGTTLSSDELKKIEALIKALEERPSLRLEIAGTADPVRDRQVLRLQKLMAEVQARWRRERGRSVATEDALSSADELRLIRELYDEHQKQAAGSVPTPRADVPAKLPTPEEMKQILVAAMPLDEEGLRNLASQRAEQVHEQLTGEGKLADERVFLLDVDVTVSDHEQIRTKLSIAAAP